MSISVQKLGELVTVRGGGTPSKKVEEYWNGDIPWASVKDLKTRVLSKTEDNITMQGVENSATNIIPKGTIIVPTRMALGKVAIAGVNLAINQDLKALLIKDENVLDKQYLARFLESQAKYIEGEGKGATVKGITLDFLKSIDVPLPPLAEQKRIAAILDKADAIRQKRKQAIDLADEFLRSVFLDMFGDPVTNPKGWEVKPLGELVENLDGKRVPIKSADRKNMFGEYPYYGASGVIDWVNDYIFDGDHLLIGEDGANLISRSTDIAFIASGKYWVNNHAHVLKQKELSLDYLRFAINLRTLAPYISGSAQPKLNQKALNSIPVQVPDGELLDKFDRIIKHTMHCSTSLSDFTSKPLFHSLSQKAFSGEL